MTPRLSNPHVELAGDGLTLIAKLSLNEAGKGFSLGSQLYDAEDEILIFEGERRPLSGSGTVETRIELPPEDGRYRIFISLLRDGDTWLYVHGDPFLLIDIAVANGRAQVNRATMATRSTLRWEALLRMARRALTYPALSVWHNRSLIRSMVRRDLMGRYRGSFGGLYWTVLNPLLLMLTYFFVFGVVLRTRFGNDPSRSGFVLYFLAGMLPWLPFSEAVGRSPFVILEHRNFVKKLVFPVEILPVTLVLAGIVTEVFALGVFTVGLLAARGAVPATVLWLPVLLVPQLLFTVGLCWMLSATGAYIRDLGQVIGFILTLWFFLTPICYPMESMPAPALWILSKNPILVLVRGYRAIFLEGQAPPLAATAKLWGVSVALFLFGYAWFYKLRKSFADVI
jgi:lipopolysaccharide transport system permease protein